MVRTSGLLSGPGQRSHVSQPPTHYWARVDPHQIQICFCVCTLFCRKLNVLPADQHHTVNCVDLWTEHVRRDFCSLLTWMPIPLIFFKHYRTEWMKFCVISQLFIHKIIHYLFYSPDVHSVSSFECRIQLQRPNECRAQHLNVFKTLVSTLKGKSCLTFVNKTFRFPHSHFNHTSLSPLLHIKSIH